MFDKWPAMNRFDVLYHALDNLQEHHVNGHIDDAQYERMHSEILNRVDQPADSSKEKPDASQ